MQQYRLPAFVVLVLLAILFALVPSDGRAQNAGDAFTLQPGEIATIAFESFCMDYGKAFPSSVGMPQSVVPDPAVRGALAFSLSNGYALVKPREVQFALWNIRGAVDSPELVFPGQDIVANVYTEPSAPAGATSVLDAMNDGRLRGSLGSFQGIGERLLILGYDDYYKGRGELVVENVSSESMSLYFPVGTLFPAPGPEYQNMVAYAAGLQVTNLQPTATLPAPTATPEAPTATPEVPTPTPEAPTATPEVPTATPEASTTTPEAPTATPADEEQVTTTPVSDVTPTPTSEEQPTATPELTESEEQPTATPLATETGDEGEATPTPQSDDGAQPTPGPAGGVVGGVDGHLQEMPNTGNIRLTALQTIILVLLGIDVVVLGFTLRRRATVM
jgi:hypothetical protein